MYFKLSSFDLFIDVSTLYLSLSVVQLGGYTFSQ